MAVEEEVLVGHWCRDHDHSKRGYYVGSDVD